MALLDIQNLTLAFDSAPLPLRVVDNLSLAVRPGEIVCLVGESGSGKSVTALSVGRLLPSPPARYLAGRIELDGHEVLSATPRTLRRLRGGVVSYIFQEPATSLNPVMSVGSQIRETLRQHQPSAANRLEVIRLLEQVGIAAPAQRCRDYPHQLSGGMQQRAGIAMALASRPKLLVADEPTASLDVTIQAQILDLLANIRQQLGMSLLFITHNLALVGELADHLAVMYAGQIIEAGPAQSVLRHPFHPYTRLLLQSVPRPGSTPVRLTAIPGSVPAMHALPSGCRFHPRCPHAHPDCRHIEPVVLPTDSPEHTVRCPYALSLL